MGVFLIDAWWPRLIEDRQAFQDAEHFRRTIEPLADTEYNWVYDYGIDQYGKLSEIYSRLDDKANEIIKYLGGGTGLVALALMTNIHS